MNNKIHIIGNAHLDPIWLWRWQEGCGEVLQTFRCAVERIKQYKGFVFTCSSASYYKWVEEIDPELFAEIKKLVKKGKWVPVNGWWVQPDCNMLSAESFARQALYSQLYYYEKFGKICKTGYNVDSFGHNAMLPQLLNNGGMRCYVMMRPGMNENADIPENLFWWDSADGSRVLTYRIPYSYGVTGKKDIDRELPLLKERVENNGHGMMFFFGVGNHGGGPTKGDMDYITELMDNGYEELEYSSPDDYFEEMCADKLDLPTWNDELQHHASGCYSATSLVKQLNRKAEYWLANAEKWNTITAKITNIPKATEDFGKAWQEVCFNQFHDILCGCSIMEAYDDVRDSMGYAMKIAANEENKAMLKIAENVDTWLDGVTDAQSLVARHHCRNLKFPRPVIVFNPNSFEVETTVRTYHPSKKVEDSNGNSVIFQNVRSSRSNDSHLDTVLSVKLPALGYSTYWLWHEDSEYTEKAVFDSDVIANDYTIENKYIKVVFDDKTGGIKSLVTKENGSEFVGGDFCVPTVIDNSEPDTWAHNIFKFDKVIGKMELDSIELIENGPARAVIRVKHTFGKSYLSQDYILDTDSKILRSKCRVLWQEPLTILKMPVTVEGENPISTYEIPAGYIKRPCNGEEEPALTWGDITAGNEARKGVALISNAKYSYDCAENTLRLTMIRNSIFADHYSDRPAADFSYCDEGLHRFEYAIYPHCGEAETSGIQKIASLFNSRPVTVPAGYHKGNLPRKKSFISINKPNIRLEAFKFCEDGSGDIV
ncbi:MAG: glycoside hydrolase family 38 C-terminal domain-containing protein, partial [Acutalibacteraceae bacterium]|nr:glycoside hydrolase family 38 C-terminal domain-containing protein [Acutalibacteraceae bacterium]